MKHTATRLHLMPASWLACSVLMALGGCASLSEDECRNADWELIGYSDASRGYQQGRVKDHSEACADLGISVNLNQYLAGYERGLPVYCTPATAFRVGEKGDNFPTQCDLAKYPSMKNAHQTGRQAYSVVQERKQVDDQLEQKRKQIDALQKSIQNYEKQRGDAKDNYAERSRINREIESLRSLIADLYTDERNLQRQRQDLTNQRDSLAAPY